MDRAALTIRLVRSEEVEAFLCIRLEALLLEPSSYASSYDDWASLTVDEWKQRMNDPVFIAFQNDEPVGIIGLLRQRASKMAHRATIVMVYVRKDLRGMGLSKRLLDVITDHARDIGIRQLELSVSAENFAAARFYLREGFSEVGRIPGGFMHDGKEIDDLLMVRRLTD